MFAHGFFSSHSTSTQDCPGSLCRADPHLPNHHSPGSSPGCRELMILMVLQFFLPHGLALINYGHLISQINP